MAGGACGGGCCGTVEGACCWYPGLGLVSPFLPTGENKFEEPGTFSRIAAPGTVWYCTPPAVGIAYTGR